MKRTKVILSLTIGLIISRGVVSSELNCTSSKLESNLSDIQKVTLSSQDCPAPTSKEFELICDQIYTKKEAGDDSELSYSYQETLWKMSCAREGDENLEEARKKIQSMWTKYRTSFSLSLIHI